MGTRWDIFLSHNSQDKTLVEALARRLLGAGVRPWLDKWELVPGEDWLHAIESALLDCRVVAVCIGPSGFGPVQDPEVQVALNTAFHNPEIRVPPVFLPGAPEDVELPAFLRQKTVVDYRDESEESFAQLLRSIGKEHPVPPHHLPSQVCPYRGLEPFLPEHNRYFFGREGEIEELLEVLRRDRQLVVVLGASGSGKSSLVLGGLVPAIRGGQFQGSYKWQVAMMRPHAEPNRSLAKALLEAQSGEGNYNGWGVRKLRNLLEADGTGLLDHCTATLRDGERLLLVVDQFEELFTAAPTGPSRTTFIETLVCAVESADSPVHLVLTLRADFLGHALREARLAPLINRWSLVITLPLMSPEKLSTAILGPAQLVGLHIEEPIVDALLKGVRDRPNSLPLLQFALMELWKRRDGGHVRYAAYRSIGGLEGALTRQAEETFGRLEPEERERARGIFMRLVRPGKETDDIRRRASWQEMESIGASQESGALASFIDARLLTADEQGVEICHDALIHQWDRLRDWIDELRDELRQLQELRTAVALWQSGGRKDEELLKGSRLQRAIELHSEDRLPLSAEEADFLSASRVRAEAEERRKEEEQRRELEASRQLAETQGRELAQRRRAQRTLGVLAIVFFSLCIGFGWYIAPIVFTPIPDLEWITIGSGYFRMGRDDGTRAESPAHRVAIDSFDIMRYEVTNANYALCVRARHCKTPDSENFGTPRFDRHPVVGINWFEARSFCNWVGARLPSEAEWEDAATWNNREGVKGNTAETANTFEGGPGETTEVGTFPNSRSPAGLDDTAGNVWEWTSSVLRPYPFDANDGREALEIAGERVVRGGSFLNIKRVATGTNRLGIAPRERTRDIGFRCARSNRGRTE